ncbi:UDP-N-acetylglucosamine 2-epimerase (hydrolyzing) [Bacillus sp. RG28]|uniref:UDP-N-acetylglucosamine 2-epimerase (Hydrolyzing) n=1 Tax=Gottfriedia endophytica TaxID=2820819 RepID=A0A940NR35_9BACI|nr:UDP-N-acetylglucosamine 2-epimerase [Gottfriedia endophytica]MBP0726734.1 UDP-N-acetylglucosamine 2-epimerase (hydrolyzing) [Gottfriedia endophytica]
MKRRKICVVTGSRAEYGLLYWLMKEIDEDPELELQLIVTGMHLSPEFGLTYKEIEKDGFYINEKVETQVSSDNKVGVVKSVGLGVIGFADSLNRLKPDVLVVLGDRYEILAAVQSAMLMNIPIAHLHGGEITEGAMDDNIRHAITKMSHIHFVANEEYKNRVVQLGEMPDSVFNYGAPGLDNIFKLNLLTKEELENELDFRFDNLSFLITFHPVTLEENSVEQVIELLKALEHFPKAKLLFTKCNSDSEGNRINEIIREFVQRNKERSKLVDSLGQVKYLSAIKAVDIVVGNSSSGLIEVPMLKKPTINIGNRQEGRLMAKSVVSCSSEAVEIKNAIQYVLTDTFQQKLESTISLYGNGKASNLIKQELGRIDLKNIVKKKFNNIKDL